MKPIELVGELGTGILSLAGIDPAGKSGEQILRELDAQRSAAVERMNEGVDEAIEALKRAKKEGR